MMKKDASSAISGKTPIRLVGGRAGDRRRQSCAGSEAFHAHESGGRGLGPCASLPGQSRTMLCGVMVAGLSFEEKIC